MNIEFLKKHPMGAAIGAVVVFVVVYYLSSKGSSSSAAATTTDPTLAIAQLQAAQNAQDAQTGAALQNAQLQAQVANNQLTAQANATANTNATQVALANISASAAVAQTNSQNNVLMTQLTDNANVETTQLNDVLAGQENTNATQLSAIQTQYGYMGTVANLQAGVASQQIAGQTSVATTQLNDAYNLATLQANNQYNLNNKVIGSVTSVNGSQNRTQLLESAINQPGAAAANAGMVNPPSTAASIVSSIGAAASNILPALFA